MCRPRCPSGRPGRHRAGQRGHLHRPAPDRRGADAARRQHRSRSRSSTSCPAGPAPRRRPWPPGTSGGRPPRRQVARRGRAARLRRPVLRAVRRLGQGDRSSGPTTTSAPSVEHCPAPCFGYSFITRQPVWPDLLDRLPVTLSLAFGAAIIWLVSGVAIGVLSALRRGQLLRPGGDERGARPACRCRSSGPASIALAFFSYRLAGSSRPAARYTPITQNPVAVGVRPDPAVDHAGPPVLGRSTPGSPGRACWRP